MHIVLGFLGTLVTVLILLNRLADLGIDLAALNPLLWRRRWRWRKRYEGDPVHAVSDPMELTALLMLATAKADGDLSSEQKRSLLGMFRERFHLCERESNELLGSSAFILKDGAELRAKLEPVVKRAAASFTPEQARSAVELCDAAAACAGESSEAQARFAGRIGNAFAAAAPKQPQSTWA